MLLMNGSGFSGLPGRREGGLVKTVRGVKIGV
jgi:hypothetical protein